MNLRRVLTALAVLAVFTAVAGAQVPGQQAISCGVSAVSTPTIRAEGINERVGDIWITCTGGPQPTAGVAVDRTTITVNFGVPVTSQVDATVTPKTSSEAVLTIDEPNTVTSSPVIAGYGQNAPISVCAAPINTVTPIVGCGTWAQSVTVGAATYWVMANAAAAPYTAAQNVYQGVNGTSSNSVNQISFTNVPVLAPYTASVSRIYRITNIRVTPGAAAAITATVTVTPNTGAVTGLVLSNSTAVVANVSTSVITNVLPLSGESLCATTALVPGAG